MCTILFLYRAHPVYPVVIAANRDEFYDRPSSGPRLLSEQPRSIGALDLQEGGTWMGANQKGVFIGLTNQRTYRRPDRSLRTRGEIARRLLLASSAEQIADQLLQFDPRSYNPFNLLFGDPGSLYLAYTRPDRTDVDIQPAPEGVHALTNDRLDSPEFPRARRAEQLAAAVCRQPWPQLAASLASILGDHQLPPLKSISEPPPDSIFSREQLRQIQAICIHTEEYGTCSSTIAALNETTAAYYLFAPGPPCKTPFEDVTGLLSG